MYFVFHSEQIETTNALTDEMNKQFAVDYSKGNSLDYRRMIEIFHKISIEFKR